MISFYVHIPFCKNKCSYCNFFVTPLDKMNNWEDYISRYVASLLSEIDYYYSRLWKLEIKTLYFWWWTPFTLWKDNIEKLINKILEKFNCEYLEELSFELNPYPVDENLEFIDFINKKYSEVLRIRFSIWIQSLDNQVLSVSNRDYNFNHIALFSRKLMKLRKNNNVFNFDFIAYWIFNKNKKWEYILWNNTAFDFFNNFVSSWFVDSFSLYTLELFPWSVWTDTEFKSHYWVDDESIYEEFSLLKKILLEAWYNRYEISNFSYLWFSSIHNNIYWNMWNYIWIWMWASSFLEKKYFESIFEKSEWSEYIRYENTKSWKSYFWCDFVDKKSIIYMTERDYNIEKLFLWLRTSSWIENIYSYSEILEDDYETIISKYQSQWMITINNDKLYLTDVWMDFYNQIVSDLIKSFAHR